MRKSYNTAESGKNARLTFVDLGGGSSDSRFQTLGPIVTTRLRSKSLNMSHSGNHD